jgi:methyl-accepting chemotaxis protein
MQKKIFLGIMVSAIVMLSLAAIFLKMESSDLENKVTGDFVSQLQVKTQNELKNKLSVGISNAVSIANNGDIQKALLENNRDLAISALGTLSENMKKFTEFKNTKVHIHTKDNHSFVRAWKPKKFGDDLSGFRRSVVSVNGLQNAVNTFEVGKAGLSVRSVVPIFDSQDSSHIGSLEFIQGLNSVARSFDRSKDTFLLLMDESVKVAPIKSNKKLQNYAISQKFVNKEFLHDIKGLKIKDVVDSKFLVTDKFIITYIDIKDFENRKLGIALVGSPISKVNLAIDSANKIIYEALFIIAISILLISTFISLFLRKSVIAPLSTLQDGLLGFFRYLNRESDHVSHINISSNDEIGIMSKVIDENIMKTQKIIDDDRKVIDNTIQVLREFEQGDLTQRINSSTVNQSLNDLKNVINNMANNLESNIDKILHILEEYSNYNYMGSIDTNGLKAHLLKLANGVNKLGDSTTSMLVENKKNGLILQEDSQILTSNVNTLNTNANQQAASLEETAASIEQMGGNIRLTTEKAQQMREVSQNTQESANKGKELALKTAVAMEDINNATSSINEAITVIEQIAFQTNILSLNAAVEAATAGESGKGFAVVAGEVRNLAGRSAEAANSIKDIVEEATRKTSEGKIISDSMTSGYEHLNQIISENTELIDYVATASREQLEGINQINDAITHLDMATQETAKIANDTNGIAIQANEIANKVVSNANAKEFKGKNDIKLEKKNITPTPKPVVQKTKPTPKRVEKKSTRSSADTQQWESF